MRSGFRIHKTINAIPKPLHVRARRIIQQPPFVKHVLDVVVAGRVVLAWGEAIVELVVELCTVEGELGGVHDVGGLARVTFCPLREVKDKSELAAKRSDEPRRRLFGVVTGNSDNYVCMVFTTNSNAISKSIDTKFFAYLLPLPLSPSLV